MRMISIRELQQGDTDHVLALDKKILGDDWFDGFRVFEKEV